MKQSILSLVFFLLLSVNSIAQDYTCEDQFNLAETETIGIAPYLDQTQILAVDVLIGSEPYTIYGVTLQLVHPEVLDADFDISFVFYRNSNGFPSYEYDGTTATILSREFVKTYNPAHGYNVYEYTIAFDSPIEFFENRKYWMVPKPSVQVAWLGTRDGHIGEVGIFSSIYYEWEWMYVEGADFVYTLHCDESLSTIELSDTKFSYYPNPVKDQLSFNSTKEITAISAYNLNGELVLNKSKINNKQIDLSDLKPGTYLFKVTLSDGQLETFKIIKK